MSEEAATITIRIDGGRVVVGGGHSGPAGSERKVSKGTQIFGAGDTARCVYVIRDGSVRITSGNTARVLYSGSAFGEDGIIGEKYSYTAIAESDTVLTEYTSDFFGDDPLYRGLAQLHRQTWIDRQEAQVINVMDRLIGRLLSLAEKHGSPGRNGWVTVSKKPTHQEIADLIGARRETITIYLGRLDAQGGFKGRQGEWLIHPENLSKIRSGDEGADTRADVESIR